MDSKTDPEELVLTVPAKDFRRQLGCSMDFGGSVIKAAYATPKGEEISIHCRSFSRDDLDGALQYLKTKANKTLRTGRSLDMCGVGSHLHKRRIEDELGVKVEIQNEMDGFVRAFRHLYERTPLESFVFPKSHSEERYVQDMTNSAKESRELMKKLDNKTEMELLDFPDDSKTLENDAAKNQDDIGGTNLNNSATKTDNGASKSDLYPVMVVMCGSSGAQIFVEEDKYTAVDSEFYLGKYFLGMGSLLTGSKSFQEMLDLAATGDNTAVDITGGYLQGQGGDEGSFYSVIPADMVIYGMGHAVNKTMGDFRKADVVASLLENIGYNLARSSYLWAAAKATSKVFFVGSFPCTSQVIRDAIGKQFGIKSLHLAESVAGRLIEHHFVRCGAYLGCFGCMFMNMCRSEEPSTDL